MLSLVTGLSLALDMTSEDRARLRHMVDALRKAKALTAGISLEQYTAADNFPLRLATERSIELTGEAAKHVSNELKAQHQEVPWRRLSGMRNHLVHGYMTIEDEIVWRAAVEFAPRLLEQLEEMLENAP